MLKKFAYYAVSVILAATMTGCSLLAPRTQTITINGNPANASIVVNGQTLQAPATVSVRRNKTANIVITKKGYNPAMHSIGHSIGPWGILDIIGGLIFLVPFVGLVSPGAYELDQDNYYYVLTPINGK